MPKYMIHASYTPEGVKGVQSKGGSSRREAISEMLEGLGGSLECMYFSFGDSDVVVIADLPDNEAATAIALTVNAAGGATTKTWPLITPEEVDAAAQRSGVIHRAGRLRPAAAPLAASLPGPSRCVPSGELTESTISLTMSTWSPTRSTASPPFARSTASTPGGSGSSAKASCARRTR
jgi:uncharacterized protein with GYD domain